MAIKPKSRENISQGIKVFVFSMSVHMVNVIDCYFCYNFIVTNYSGAEQDFSIYGKMMACHLTGLYLL